jgi:hypothetical protein
MSSAPRLNPLSPWQQLVDEEWNTPVDTACVGVAENMPPENLLHLATDLGFLHICQKQGHGFDKEVQSAAALIGQEEAFLHFPIASVLAPTDLSVARESKLLCLDYSFSSSGQKRELLDEAAKASQAKGLSQTLVSDILSVADEMFTNAVFNAPFVDINTQKNPGINRHADEVKMDVGKAGRFFMASAEDRLLIGCKDPYGSLDLKRYLNKIKATFGRGPAATMNFGPGGAGIGSYIIFNAGSSLYFAAWPGRATIICCVIPLGISNRKRMELPKHLHWIQR